MQQVLNAIGIDVDTWLGFGYGSLAEGICIIDTGHRFFLLGRNNGWHVRYVVPGVHGYAARRAEVVLGSLLHVLALSGGPLSPRVSSSAAATDKALVHSYTLNTHCDDTYT